MRLSFTNRLNLQRVYLPRQLTIQKRCPLDLSRYGLLKGKKQLRRGSKGQFSPFYRCGYSADQTRRSRGL